MFLIKHELKATLYYIGGTVQLSKDVAVASSSDERSRMKRTSEVQHVTATDKGKRLKSIEVSTKVL